MENQPVQKKGKGGRKPKADADKATHKVGSFWLTPSEKQAYDRLFEASGLENQTEFFRRIIFRGGLKLYYTDKHTERIYAELLRVEREINQIGVNYNQVVRRVNAVSSDQSLFGSLKELKELTRQMEEKFREMLPLFEQYSPFHEQ